METTHETAIEIEAAEEGLRFAGLSLAINTMMAALKICIGIFSGSHALLANSLYSINDVLSSIAVSISMRLGFRDPDEEYPYGYGNAEYIATGVVSLTIALGVFFLLFYSVLDVLRGVDGPPHVAAMTMAGISLAVSWWLARKSHHYAEELNSPTLTTSAEHSHADAVGSLAALIGIGGAIFGLHVLDRIIAIFEVLHLIALSGTLLGRSLKGLMDRALPDEDVELIESACLSVEGVAGVAHVRSRQLGRHPWVDVGLTVEAGVTVARAKEIADTARSTVIEVLGPGAHAHVSFHGPDFEDDPVEAGGSGHG